MALQYASKLPIDASGNSMQEFLPPKQATAKNYSENGTTSSIITLNDNTTTLDVTATGGAVAGKWINVGDTTAQSSVITAVATFNADFVIPANYYRRIPVPIEVMPTPSMMSGGGSLSRNGLFGRVALKAFSNASVITIQYP